MKLFLILLSLAVSASSEWLTDINNAKMEAVRKNKYILLNFSGSDWCIPCMRLKKQVFDTEKFSQFADSNLVLVNIDFPRGKKVRPGKQQTAQNEMVAEQYDPTGKFPFTLLLTAEGKTLKSWDGTNTITSGTLINEIKMIVHGGN